MIWAMPELVRHPGGVESAPVAVASQNGRGNQMTLARAGGRLDRGRSLGPMMRASVPLSEFLGAVSLRHFCPVREALSNADWLVPASQIVEPDRNLWLRRAPEGPPNSCPRRRPTQTVVSPSASIAPLLTSITQTNLQGSDRPCVKRYELGRRPDATPTEVPNPGGRT